ncbi:hypothetical protein RHGRI_034046 [Rhododendron griersonianum]|uniref:Uncharacterized protein n=1 Tax=Rhododendron griersonianum TaxID=479676 RepID=A0AAV6HYZ9_9ERIC|nr:hypothetical protein RHGRI_034046 [Rhododendron griersonianum]
MISKPSSLSLSLSLSLYVNTASPSRNFSPASSPYTVYPPPPSPADQQPETDGAAAALPVLAESPISAFMFYKKSCLSRFQNLLPNALTAAHFVVDGVFFTELNDVLMRELAEVRVTPMRIEITIRATRYQNILDEPGKQMRSDVRIKNTSSSHVASRRKILTLAMRCQ